MELNAEQIKKALECCTRGRKSKEDRPCLDCPYNECNIVGGTSERQVKGTCQGWLMKDALALITSQEQRIKELTEENESLGAEKEHLELVVEGKLKRTYALEKQVLKLNEENERLSQSLANLKLILANSKADTVKEFAESLKQVLHDEGRISYYSIDKIAKDMLEGENEN